MIPYGRHFLDEDDIQSVIKVLREGPLTQGHIVEAFEAKVAETVGAKYAVAVSSGTAGLHLAAIVSGLGPDKGMITSPITFVATANAATYVGAPVKFVDIDPLTINMSITELERQLLESPSVGAIFPVHFAGLPCDMERIRFLADKYGKIVVEDAAHALGATYENGSKVGSCEYSDMTVFSLHPVKSIAAGEGGVITTNDEQIYRGLIRLRSHGINKLDDELSISKYNKLPALKPPWYYEMQQLGFNYRITDIQCGLALSQLKKLDKFIGRRKVIADKYDSAFRNMKHLTPWQNVNKQNSSHHLYVLNIDFDGMGMTRTEFISKLKFQGIGSQVHYIPAPAHPFYKNLGHKIEKYKNAQFYYERTLSIPIFYSLADDEQDKVISVIKGISS